MATSAPMRAFVWGDGLTVAAQDMRLSQHSMLLSAVGASSSSQLAVRSGVRDGAGSPLQAAVTSGLSVSVQSGCVAIQGSAAADSGAYGATLDGTATLTCTTADTVNPRIDTVAVTITDLGSSSSTAVVQIVTGTAAASPAPATLPANSLTLCYVLVNANQTTLTSGSLTDQRPFLAGAGGIVSVLNSGFYPSVGPKGFVLDVSLNRLKYFNGTAMVAPSVAAFATIASTPGNATATSATWVTATSASVTVDGNTNVEITASFKYISTSSTGNGTGCTIGIFRGSSLINDIVAVCSGTNSTLNGGGFSTFDPTPAAGTYTYSLQIQNQGAGNFALDQGRIIVKAAAS
ncbi:MAG TPA: hypothetical protein VGG83_10735 [Trebonia sp.]|jgi:hypothetical protein